MNTTERVRRHFSELAPKYDRRIKLIEKVLLGDGRPWVCAQVRGNVLEVAVGTGLNLPFYAEGARLTAVDLSEAMLDIARRRAARLGRQVNFQLGDATALPLPA